MVPGRDAAGDLDVDFRVRKAAARDRLGDHRRPAIPQVRQRDAERPRALFQTLEMLGLMKGNPGVDSQQFIHTVPELEAPVLDRNPRLGERQKDVVDEGDLRHA